LKLEASNQLVFSDVWVGEVWVASGQSNMEMSLHAAAGAELATANGCSGLHLFVVRHTQSLTPKTEPQGHWAACTPVTAKSFSGVAFYFARELQRALGVPIGVIEAAWGGTPAEAWTPRSALLAEPSLAPLVNTFDAVANDPAKQAELRRKLRDWEAKSFVQDEGNRGEAKGLARLPHASRDGWASMTIPQTWEKAGLPIDGAVWFHREIIVPDAWAKKELLVSLGALDDFDVAYWNGERIGATGVETPEFWSVQRNYTVPASSVHPGRNLIAVRIFDRGGDGGFAGAPAELFVKPKGSDDTAISLAGTWLFKVERRVTPVAIDWHRRPALIVDDPSNPTVLWNAEIAPLTSIPVAGVIWYQGESNVARATQYRTLFPTLIRSWREAWNAPRLPFVFVQLPNYQGDPVERSSPLGTSTWAELREAQTAALKLPAVDMAVTVDVGESQDPHPHNKHEVGRRLALAALRTAYAKPVIASGPRFASAAIEGNTVRVRFTAAPGGMSTSDGTPPQGFIIAGADHVWHHASARVENTTAIVSSPDVPAPVAVRYGWANDPVVTLMNLAALPAAPFRTDNW
jgi:sialate O-acetylesterase